jgi:hypothetical protein
MAWTRLGVPDHIAKYLVEMDIGGKTAPRTPYTQNIQNKKGYRAIFQHKKFGMWFIALMGCAQGDVPSPFNWNAFMDILHRALELTSDDYPLYIKERRSVLRRVIPISYADDLLQITSGIKSMQAQADTVSAFCTVFGIRININKLKFMLVHWGREKAVTDESHIHIRTLRGENVSVPVATDGTFEHVGITHDISQDTTTQFRITKEKLRNACATIIAKRQYRMGDRILAINMVIIPQVLYPARNIGWSQNQILQLERILSSTYRQVLNLRGNFPTELLYLDQNKAGIGLVRLSDILNKQKVKRMLCMAYGRPFTNIALTAQIDLALKLTGKESHPWAHTSIDPTARYEQSTCIR